MYLALCRTRLINLDFKLKDNSKLWSVTAIDLRDFREYLLALLRIVRNRSRVPSGVYSKRRYKVVIFAYGNSLLYKVFGIARLAKSSRDRDCMQGKVPQGFLRQVFYNSISLYVFLGPFVLDLFFYF